jgi:hypothetical protein
MRQHVEKSAQKRFEARRYHELIGGNCGRWFVSGGFGCREPAVSNLRNSSINFGAATSSE